MYTKVHTAYLCICLPVVLMYLFSTAFLQRSTNKYKSPPRSLAATDEHTSSASLTLIPSAYLTLPFQPAIKATHVKPGGIKRAQCVSLCVFLCYSRLGEVQDKIKCPTDLERP